MPQIESATIGWLAALVEFGGALVIAGYGIAALAGLILGYLSVGTARLMVASGALSALSFKVAATLLKTIELQSLDQIGAAFAILVLRKLIRASLDAERRDVGMTGG